MAARQPPRGGGTDRSLPPVDDIGLLDRTSVDHIATEPFGSPAAAAADSRQSMPTAAPIEIEYIRVADNSALPSKAWPMLEIWTRNRAYHIDDKMICVAVVGRDGIPDPKHALLGARLTGGERRSKVTAAVEILTPLPVPGSDAVFFTQTPRGGQFARSSTIERMVLRIRKVRVGAPDADPSWNDYTGRFVVK